MLLPLQTVPVLRHIMNINLTTTAAGLAAAD